MKRLMIDVLPTDWSPKKTILHFIAGPVSVISKPITNFFKGNKSKLWNASMQKVKSMLTEIS
jgi:hypothetical protein